MLLLGSLDANQAYRFVYHTYIGTFIWQKTRVKDMQNILIINSIKYVEQIIKFAWKINAIMELRRSIISRPVG